MLQVPVSNETLLWSKKQTPEILQAALEIGRFAMENVPVKQQIAVTRGQVGEAFVEQILREKFEVTNVTSQAHSGDLSLSVGSQKIMVEVKNYSKPVPSSQVEKFQRDLITARARGGVFISLNTPIATVTNDMVLRFEGAIPCVYICDNNSHAIICATNLVSCAVSLCDRVAAETKSRGNIVSAAQEISSALNKVSSARNELARETTSLISKFCTVSAKISSAEIAIRESVEKIQDEIPSPVGCPLLELENNPSWKRQSDSTKQYVCEIIHLMPTAAWNITKKKFSCERISFTLWASKISVNLARTQLDDSSIIDALTLYKSAVTIDDMCNIDLRDDTVDWIRNIIGFPARAHS